MKTGRRWIAEIESWEIHREGGGRYVVVTPSGMDMAWLDTEQMAREYIQRRLEERR